MIDIHSHILPGVDDGAKHITESIAMAKIAVSEGIRTIIATPHHKNGFFENEKFDIIEKVAELNDALKAESIGLDVLAGQETRIYGDILADYHAERILTLNDGGRYVFIELPADHVPAYTEPLLYELQMKGLVPIIVHPERNLEFMESPNHLYKLVKHGALTQITAKSIVGGFGKKTKKFAFQLIEKNLTHYIASDAHNTKSRAFHMAEAFTEVENKFGFDMRYLFMDNAELLVQGKLAYKEIPQKIESRKFLGIF
ncbi:tyrosine-protein phosphatase [Bacillus sp. ISL-57]|uniref:tyrosine-protein phosphatase n=1 Tax=Bacillus sp. ISL-57 TaxID=2819135 RepID=UPI001BE55770|nr:CpsB/CapC family capsule biosynthesis tyrosine phosphatase [Bacillus sp. ISL-57]MBT2718152.1 tyrosine protein phosphatase [Bacillus sp. ISL-57]